LFTDTDKIEARRHYRESRGKQFGDSRALSGTDKESAGSSRTQHVAEPQAIGHGRSGSPTVLTEKLDFVALLCHLKASGRKRFSDKQAALSNHPGCQDTVNEQPTLRAPSAQAQNFQNLRVDPTSISWHIILCSACEGPHVEHILPFSRNGVTTSCRGSALDLASLALRVCW
jgi:hypothetical protein